MIGLVLWFVTFIFAFATIAAPAPKPLIDPTTAIKQFHPQPGFKIDLFASEPQLLNPVAFSIDEQGRVFVAETFRYRKSVYDIRGHMNMYLDDLAARTVEDRVAVINKYLGTNAHTMTNESEKIQLLEDRSGSGKADFSTEFATGFDTVVDGLGAGILARNGKVWYTDIPNLWLLSDSNHTGHAETRESLAYGFGVHFGYTGHDLHGPRMGPDGRIYFSIGDRGIHVVTREGKTLDYPDTGSVLRCNPDGSDLEVFAYGVRNPQELAFDDVGDLFSGDNNCDHGDAARLIYIVKDGDSGWRNGYQISETTPAGMWNAEGLWHLPFEGQAAYLVPPVAHIAQGPAGFSHYPGVGFSDEWNDHFFLCDYKGASVNSGIHSFAVKPSGAGFTMVDHKPFLWGILATDVEFAPDGRLFVADWVAHWPVTDKGRLYRLYDTNLEASTLAATMKKILHDGMEHRPLSELQTLLNFPDQRVRMDSQFEIVARAQKQDAPAALNILFDTARAGANRLGRLHGIWGLAQAARLKKALAAELKPLAELLHDDDSEVRAQTAKALGEAQVKDAAPALIGALSDANARVRFFSAISLGELGAHDAVVPLVELLRTNADQDAFLRHGGVMGLVGCASDADLNAAAKDTNASVRMGVLLTMRRRLMPEIATFVTDPEPRLRVEAARAINDAPIPAAMPALAAQVSRLDGEFFDWRALNANFRLGGREQALALAAFAANSAVTNQLRIESLHFLETWANPSPRDRITGLWRPLPARDGAVASVALGRVIEALLAGGPDDVRVAALKAAKGVGLTNIIPQVLSLAFDTETPPTVRVASIAALNDWHDDHAADVARKAIKAKDRNVRAEGIRVLAEIFPDEAVKALGDILEHAPIGERQKALVTLGKIKGDTADNLIVDWLDRIATNGGPKEIRFDVVEVAEHRKSADVERRLAQFRAAQPTNDDLVEFRDTQWGGDVTAGRKIFMERAEAGCVTCHKIDGKGGDAGPDLAGILKRHDRAYVLESIIFPNRQIAAGFENAVVKTKDGALHAGIVKEETADSLLLTTVEDGETNSVTIPKSDIQSRQRGLSAMPEGLGKVLTKREIRDVIAFLAQTKQAN